MLLGGNLLPDSLSQYMLPGNNDDDVDGADTDTFIDQEQQNDDIDDDEGLDEDTNRNKKMAS